MKLISYEITLNLIEGLLLGVYHEDFVGEDVLEKDFNICLFMFTLRFTRVYGKEE